MFEGDKAEDIENLEEKEIKDREERDFESMETIISELEAQNEELKDKYLRALANYENLRKRAIQEKEKIYNFALEEVFRKILSILDDFERAFKSFNESEKHKKDYKSFQEGIRLVHSNLETLLKMYNIEPFESVGKEFDPSKHEAIHVIEQNDEEDGKILEETETGYKIRDKVLRPAKVIVAKKTENKENKNNEKDSNRGGQEE